MIAVAIRKHAAKEVVRSVEERSNGPLPGQALRILHSAIGAPGPTPAPTMLNLLAFMQLC